MVISDWESNSRSCFMTDVVVSWYNTFDAYGWFGLHITPRFIQRRVSYTLNSWEEPFVEDETDVDVEVEELETKTFQLRGIAVGLSLGKYLTLMGEYALYQVEPATPVASQRALSYAVIFGTHLYDTD